jgi:hypothetical protein
MRRLKWRSHPAEIGPVERRSMRRLLVLGWVLIHAGRDGWEKVGDFYSSVTCQQVCDVDVANAVQREIGSVLANQPVDNPMRQEAYGRAERRIRPQYRCEWQGS